MREPSGGLSVDVGSNYKSENINILEAVCLRLLHFTGSKFYLNKRVKKDRQPRQVLEQELTDSSWIT